MDFAWLNNGEYWVDVEKIRTGIMKQAISAKTEAQTAEAFQRQLYFYVRLKTGIELDFQQETPIRDGLTHTFGPLQKRQSGRGRLDAVVNSLIIEYKKNKKLRSARDQETAKNQVVDYLLTLLKNDGVKYNAILTDGIRISYFGFNGDEVKSTAFSSIDSKDIDRIIRAILSNQTKKFVPENVLKDFAVDSNVDSISRNLAICLFKKLCDQPTSKTEMLYTEWESLMHLSYDDNGKGNDIAKRRKDLSLIFKADINDPCKEYRALFALQTTYAIIVKLIACKVIDKLDFDDSTKAYSDLTNVSASELQSFLETLEDGYVYRSSNIVNLLEGDFFSWYSTKEQWNEDLWKLILNVIQLIDEYSVFSFDAFYEPVDIFKEMYMSIMPKSVRHSMGEYYTPSWLSEYVIDEAIKLQGNSEWTAIDPCCGSGTFILSLIKKIVGDVDINQLSDEEKQTIKQNILNRVYGIDINPLSVLSARVGYYLALRPFGDITDIEIPIYLGDSAIIPVVECIDGIPCYKYSVVNNKKSFDVVLPIRFVKHSGFGKLMASLQSAVKTDDKEILFEMLTGKFTDEELTSSNLMLAIRHMTEDLIELHKNNWDGIWIRIATNFMLIARMPNMDLIVGNPPWVKWEHLPSKYAEKIKELCNLKHIFKTNGRFGGTQLNICALIANQAACNWLKPTGVLAFLMPDSIMSQSSYSEFRKFYTDYDNDKRLYLQRIDKWEKPIRPFVSEGVTVTQDFNTYYYSSNRVDYAKGIDAITITRNRDITDIALNKINHYKDAKKYLVFGKKKAAQISKKTTAFSYLSNEYTYNDIIGDAEYEFRTGVEFTPQQLYMLEGKDSSRKNDHYKFKNKVFKRVKYKVSDMPVDGWDLPTKSIYPIVTGPSITPFHCSMSNEFCILPYTCDNTDTPISSSDLMKNQEELFNYLLNHKSLIDQQSEKSKQLHRGNEFYALSKIGPYTFSKYIVAARDNTKFCATVIEPEMTPWEEKKQRICVKHTILIGRDIDENYITKDEAYYICGILNCDLVIGYIHNTFKKNGFSLKDAHFYLPKYDSNDSQHKQIVSLSKKASSTTDEKVITSIQKNISSIYLDICKNR